MDDLLKAFRASGPLRLPAEDRAIAAADADDLRGELTGLMNRALPRYEEDYGRIQELKKTARGKRKADLVEAERRLRDRTEWEMRTLLNRYYRDQFVNGMRSAGNPAGLRANEKEILRRLVNNEMEFLQNALLDAETGEYKMPLDRRGALYGNAVDEARWFGWLYADLSAGRFVKWHMEDLTEDCLDCAWLAGRLDVIQGRLLEKAEARGHLTESEQIVLGLIDQKWATQGGRWGNGVYRAQELVHMGVAPQSPLLICTTHCKCHLEEAERPAAKTKQKEARVGFASAIPKVPTMLLRETKPKERGRLAVLAGVWGHEHVGRREKLPEPEHLHVGKEE